MNFEAKSFLPVTAVAVDRALSEIAENPADILVEEGAHIQLNPHLNMELSMRSQQLNTSDLHSTMYIEGALWTHRIFRTQAKINRTQLPIISPNVAMAYDQSRIEEIRDMGVRVGILIAVAALRPRLNEEPELVRGLTEITKYRMHTEAFWGAAAEVYLLLKAADEAKKIEGYLR